MSAQTAPPGPIDCLQRGLRSLRANWELVPLLWLQTLLSVGLALAGVFVLLAGLGVGVVGWLRDLGPGWRDQLADEVAAGLDAGLPALTPLVAPLIAATLLWSLAFVVYCYLQGGVMGVVARAEMTAGPGLPGWREFRVFSGERFDRQGRRLFWRYFWLNHLIAAAVLLWALVFAGLIALSVWLATDPDTRAGFAVGCVGLVPLLVVLLVIGAWSMLAAVEAARPGGGVWGAGRRALGHLRRRLVAVLVIGLLAVAGVLIVSAAFMPLEWWVSLAAGDRISVWLGGRGVLLLAKSLAGHTLTVAVIATLAALVGLRPAAEAEAEGAR